MRYVLVGAVDSTQIALDTLVAEGVTLGAVVTLSLEVAHRHSDFCDLGPRCEEEGIPILHCRQINTAETVEAIRQVGADGLIVIGWSQILGTELLALPWQVALGFHPTLLPDGRGRAAIPWTILRGLSTSGATLFHLADGVDSGDIAAQKEFAVPPRATAASLYEEALRALEDIIRALGPALKAGSLPRHPQRHEDATYTARRTPEDGRLDWRWPAEEVDRLIRASGRPYPGAFTDRGAKRLVCWSSSIVSGCRHIGVPGQVLLRDGDGVIVQCGAGHIRLLEVSEGDGPGLPAAEVLTKMHEVLGRQPV